MPPTFSYILANAKVKYPDPEPTSNDFFATYK